MKTILIPLTLDSQMLSVFEYAEPIAKEMDASLLLLHVVKKQSYDNGTFSPKTDVYQRVTQEARMILEHLARQAIVHGIRAKVMVTDGTPADVILDTAKSIKADLILMGRPCSNQNCTSERVLSSALCPVLTWRGDEVRSRESSSTAPSSRPASSAHLPQLAAA